jgi:WD40 repeat protein
VHLNTFKAYNSCYFSSDSYILCLAWGSNQYGDLLAIGTLKKKISVFLNWQNIWSEVAWFEDHQGSIRKVVWADPTFGCHLFACSNDGYFSISEAVNKEWQSSLIKAHDGAVNCISLRRVPFLGEVF